MNQKPKPHDQFPELPRLTADDLILFQFINCLTDETFAAEYCKANNLNTQSPDYRPVQ